MYTELFGYKGAVRCIKGCLMCKGAVRWYKGAV